MSDDELIARYIELDPRRPGKANARLVDYGVAVWALVGYLQVMDWDIDRVAAGYDVPREAVEAAIAYYRRHKDLIDYRREANRA